MSTTTRSTLPGYEVPLHRALTEPVLLAGAPRTITILNATVAASIGLGLRLWIVGIVLWLVAQTVAVWATRKDPAFGHVLSRHVAHKAELTC